MKPRLTPDDYAAAARGLNVETAALRAVVEVECRGRGFLSTGEPVILYEPHIFSGLTNGRHDGAEAVVNGRTYVLSYPKLKLGTYGPMSHQHGRLAAAVKLDRDAALKACSWGLGQVLGRHWHRLGYGSLQAFINAMYESEARQLDAVCRYIVAFDLVTALQRHEWDAFALGYNGRSYAKHKYHLRLAEAHRKHAAREA